MRRFALCFELGLLLAVLPAIAPGADTDLVQRVSNAAKGLNAMHDDDDSYKDAANLASARTCLEAIAAARNGGVADAQEIDVGMAVSPYAGKYRYDRANAKSYVPMSQIEAYCQSVLSAIPARQVSRQLRDAESSLKRLRSLNPDDDLRAYSTAKDIADSSAKNCTKAVLQAIKAGVSSDAMLTRSDKSQIALRDADAQVCQPVAEAVEAAVAEIRKRLEAQLEPFRNALSGDKWKVFEKHFGLDASARGKGGDVLENPMDYASASVWFATFTFDGELCDDTTTHWRLVRYEFKGMKLKGTKETTGCGTEPPSKAFK